MELGEHIGFYNICKKYLASIFELNVCLNFAGARPEAVVHSNLRGLSKKCHSTQN